MDSEAKIVASMQAAIRDAALPERSNEQVRQIIGLGLFEAIKTLYPAEDEQTINGVQRQYSSHYIKADQQPCRFFPGALDFVRLIRQSGHKTAVATGKSRRGLDRVMAAHNVGHLFDSSRCADETRSKPDPLMLEQLLAEFACPPADALMIGDTEFDLRMALNAGVSSVGVSFGVHSVERLTTCLPEAVVDSYSELTQHWQSMP